jgi:tetratricopeptide (TPR) repeat protein
MRRAERFGRCVVSSVEYRVVFMACRPIILDRSPVRALRWIAVAMALLVCAPAAPRQAEADAISGELSARVEDGFARLVFTLTDAVDSSVRLSGNVLIISFKQPVAVQVDKLAIQLPDYIGAARRDPDGKGVRIALSRKVTANSTHAAEKLFVDLLPDTWEGPPPGLPQDVVEELARRARDAERLERQRRQFAQQRKIVPVRVRVAVQPTFTRYLFEVSDQVAVAADHGKDRLTLTFDSPIKFDLADVKAALPAVLEDVSTEIDQDTASVRFIFVAKIDVRTFHDDSGYVVDVVTGDKAPAKGGAADSTERRVLDSLQVEGAPPKVAPPATIPADQGGAPAPLPQVAPAKPSAQLTPPATLPPVTEAKAEAPAPAVAPPPAKAEIQVAAPSPPPTAPGPAAAETAARKPKGAVAVELARQGENLKLSFAFATKTSAAVFRRADSLWIVFDSKADIDLSALKDDTSRTIRNAEVTRAPDGDIVHISLERPRLSSAAVDGPVWTITIGDEVLAPTRALDINRNVVGPNRSIVTIPFEEPHHLHRLHDPEVGDSLFVVTAFGPARGFLKTQDFVEFRALASTQGVVVQPLADDINVELSADKIIVGRPNGLALSTSAASARHGSGLRPVVLDSQAWGFDRQATFVERQSQLVRFAAEAPESKRMASRVNLARFYLARDMFPEAKSVLDVVLGAGRPAAEEASAYVLRAVAEVMMNRPEAALKDLANPAISNQYDAPLWRAVVHAHQGKWAEAREGFKSVESSIATLPMELQRRVLKDALRSSIEVRDFATATTEFNEFEAVGVPHEMEPSIAVLSGRLAEGMNRTEDALASYRTAADSWDRPAAAQGRLREIVLRYSLGDLKREEVITELETLTTVWRGDETEVEALQLLARLYTEDGRYRDSFYVMRSAMTAHPDSDMTRRIQDAAAATFDALFLAGKGDAMPAIDALALFYDFRELTPIGRRGDEMIRRLADRLVSVDLLDQGADLLQYQVDHRLQGAARAQVATRLAVVYLMNHTPDRALAALRATRTADLSTELRNQRLLLEARALSDAGRSDVALEVISNIDGREAIRLRSDILWNARRWRESAEQLELLYGDRWKDWQPLNDVERSDVLRAAIGFALGEDKIGLNRFREKFAAKMAEGPDGRAFEVAAAPLATSSAEFAAISHAAASVDTLDGFLRDLQARYPETGTMLGPEPAAAAKPAVSDAAAKAAPAAEAEPAVPAASPPLTKPADPARTSAAPAPAIATRRTASR